MVTTASFSDTPPVIVPSADACAIVIWKDPGNGIYAQKVDRYGVPQWNEEVLVSYTGATMFGAARGPMGGAYIAWVVDGPWDNVYVVRIDSDGNLMWANEVLVGWGDTPVAPPIVVPDGQTGVIVCWQAGSTTTDVLAQRLSSIGVPQWASGQMVGVRTGAEIPENGLFRAIPDGAGGLYAAWTERPLGVNITRVQWLTDTGDRHWQVQGGPDTGFDVVTTPEYQTLVDMAVDKEAGFFVLFYKDGVGLCGQNIVPDPTFTEERKWGDGGQLMASGFNYFNPVYPAADRKYLARIIDPVLPATGSSIVLWTEGEDMFAQKFGRAGTPMWNGDKVAISTASGIQYPKSLRRDGAGGVYIAWDEGDNVYATRVNENIMAQLDVTISTFGICSPGTPYETYFSMPDTAVNGCPQGDQDYISVHLEISGDVMTAIPKEAITIAQPEGGNVVFFEDEIADYDPVLDGDVYRTTITIEKFSGCGEDAAMVSINGIDRGYAHINVKSPDLERVTTLGSIGLLDYSEFAMHYQSTPCECIPNFMKPFDDCVDYTIPPDTTIGLLDFSTFYLHYGHQYQAGGGGQSSPAVSYCEGDIRLKISEENPLTGKRKVNCAVSLDNVEPYSVLLLSFKNDNPDFEFLSWNQSPDCGQQTMCTEVMRNGQREIVLSVIGSQETPANTVNLGTIELSVRTDNPLALTEEDLALVTGDLLGSDGRTKMFSGSRVHRNLTPHVYRNSLAQNYPNPFNPITTIAFSIADDAQVSLRVYDVTGALVRTLVDESRKKNNYRITWDGKNNQGTSVASGVYFYRLVAGDFQATKKMVLLR